MLTSSRLNPGTLVIINTGAALVEITSDGARVGRATPVSEIDGMLLRRDTVNPENWIVFVPGARKRYVVSVSAMRECLL